MAKTPWFNVVKQPPVNGGQWSLYEWRCPNARVRRNVLKPKSGLSIRFGACPHCEWRGLTKPAAQSSAEPPRDIDALAERLIEESDGRWHDGEFRIDSRDLMTMLRRAMGHAHPSADPWRDAADQMLATTEQTASDDPRESINRLIDWHVDVALDPAVSSDARALVQRGRDECLMDYSMLHRFAAAHPGVDYNELCTTVRAALGVSK